MILDLTDDRHCPACAYVKRQATLTPGVVTITISRDAAKTAADLWSGRCHECGGVPYEIAEACREVLEDER